MQSFARSIVETVRHPLLVLDAEFKVVVANESFYHSFDCSMSTAVGHTLFELDDGRFDQPLIRNVLGKVMHPDGCFRDVEVEYDGHLDRRTLLLNGHRVTGDRDGEPMILLAIDDATERRQVRDGLCRQNRELKRRDIDRTAELEMANQDLEAANRELEAFSYSVSHDLRAPLRALEGFSDELLRTYAERLDDKGRHYLQRIRTGTKRMGELIDDLLQLSRLGRTDMNPELVDLTGMALTVATELKQQGPDRHVTFDIQPDMTCEGDTGLIKIVLENLLSNAWKFTGKKAAPTIAFGSADYQGQPAFFVRDDGAGFDMSHASKLFGAFQRLHAQRDFPGNGIGLATVQRIVHKHGGKVWVESQPELGAKFYFTLPAKGKA